MALIACPDCGTEVSDQAAACPKCARPIAQAATGSKSLGAGPGCALIVAGFMTVMAIAVGTECGSSSSKSASRSAAPASNYCSNWGKTNGDRELQRVAVLENVKQLDGGKVNKACLARQTDELVRWVNRLCGSGMTVDHSTFAMALTDEARKRCP